jgi:hypothetical protein
MIGDGSTAEVYDLADPRGLPPPGRTGDTRWRTRRRRALEEFVRRWLAASAAAVAVLAAAGCTASRGGDVTEADLDGLGDTSRTGSLARDRTRTATGCRSAIVCYTGVPDDTDVQFRSGWISYNPTRTEWRLGERRVRCFLWFGDRTLTRSLKSAGPAALPVH